MPPHEIERQAIELDLLLTDLIKRYQFRDRNTICCEDVTVSQCYALKELGQEGSLAMTRLAERMRLTISTLTRIVDQLERKGYAKRRRLPADRRIVHVELTTAGRSVLRRIETLIRESECNVLRRLSRGEREGLLTGLRRLNAALDARDQGTQ